MSYGANILDGFRQAALRRPHPQRRKTCGPASHAVEQVRVGHQRRDRQDTRPHYPPTLLARADEVIE